MQLWSAIHRRLTSSYPYATGVLYVIVFLISLILGVTVLTTQVVTATDQQLHRNLERLLAVVGSDELPEGCATIKFPFFYAVTNSELDVHDQSTLDWQQVHLLAAAGSSFDRASLYSPKRSDFQNFLDFNFIQHRNCGIAITPFDGNHITSLTSRLEYKVKYIERDFRIWLARSKHDADRFYVLARIENIDPDQGNVFERFLIDLHYPRNTIETLQIDQINDGLLDITQRVPITENIERATLRQDDRIISANGRWWTETAERQTILYLELEFASAQTTAIALTNSSRLKRCELSRVDCAMSVVGTHGPIPFRGDTRTYSATIPFSQLFSHFEIYLNDEQVLHVRDTASVPDKVDPETTFRKFVFWPGNVLMDFAYKTALALNGVAPCPGSGATGEATCYLASERGGSSPTIRAGLFGQVMANSISIYMEQSIESPFFSPVSRTLVTAAVFLLGSTLLFSWQALRLQSQHKITSRRLSRTNAKLENISERLFRINESLKQYADNFLHEGENRLIALRAKVSRLPGGEEESILEDFATVMLRLKDSSSMFQIEDMVCKELDDNAGESFDLRASLERLIGELVEHETIVGIEFISCVRESRGSRLMLPAVSSPGRHRQQDDRFKQAIEKLLQNASDYRDNDTRIKVSLTQERGWAVIKIYNKGPTIDEAKLEEVFDFGSQFGGANAAEPRRRVPSSDHDHLGLGLFVARQIIRAYGGRCRLVNAEDGVIAEVRLPSDDR